jgi:5-(carboxyamino)imidazole ribonucleotide mutase
MVLCSPDRLLSLILREGSVRVFYIGRFGGERMSAQAAVIMGSKSDWETMKHACGILEELEIPYEKKVVSAHRTPDLMFEYAEQARDRTTLPVIGVPVQSKALNGLDSLLSIVQMPGGVPVATVAIGKAGATNAGLLAAQILGAFDTAIAERLQSKRDKTKQEVLESSDELV